MPGLRAGHYLCLFGMHVLTPSVMEFLGEMIAAAPAAGRGEPIMLSPALEKLARRERYLALELEGTRYNIGVKYGMLDGPVGPGPERQRPRGDPRPAGRTAGSAMTSPKASTSRIPNPLIPNPLPYPPHAARSDRDHHQ